MLKSYLLLIVVLAAHFGRVGSTLARPPPSSREWGVNAHFGRTGGAATALLKRVATAYATVRLDMSWGVVETAKGEYNGFGLYDA